MKKINLNNWFVENNELNINLSKFVVQIKTMRNDHNIYFQLLINDNEQNEFKYFFDSLEHAILFTEDIVSNANNKDDIFNGYSMLLKNNIIQNPYLNENDINDNQYIILSKDDIKDILTNYFSDTVSKMSIKEKISMVNGKISVSYFITRLYTFEGAESAISTEVNEYMLSQILTKYLDNRDYILIKYKFIGVSSKGNCFKEESPQYSGIKVEVKEKARSLSRKK